MPPKQGTPRSLHEVVADRIRAAILAGDLEPGARLVEDKLAREYGVSRHPVREALRTLSLEGLVEISPRRGATVSSTSPGDVVELLEMLAALAGLSARLACEPREGLALLAANLDHAQQILAVDELQKSHLHRLGILNREFHSAVDRAGGNQHLIETIGPIRDRVESNLTAAARQRPETSWAEHQQIYNAIQSADAPLAEELARDHVDRVRRAYVTEAAGSN